MTFIQRLQMMWRVRTESRFERELARMKAEKAELLQESERLTYQTLGMLTRAWAGLEIMLDMINWAIAWRQDSKDRFPVSLGVKVAYFRAAHNKLPELAPLREAAARIADDIVTASKTRHKLIHGYVQGDLKGDTFEMLLHFVPKGENSHMLYRDEVTVERDELFELSTTISALSQRLLAHAEVMIPALPNLRDDAAG